MPGTDPAAAAFAAAQDRALGAADLPMMAENLAFWVPRATRFAFQAMAAAEPKQAAARKKTAQPAF